MNHYTATVTREGKWWMVSIPEIEGLTQARRLSEAKKMAQEYVAVTLDVPIELVDIELTIEAVGDVEGINAILNEIHQERVRAVELERDAARKATTLAKDLAAEGVPVRDVGTVLGVSYQRAHQLVSA